jgi:hypothetical protein
MPAQGEFIVLLISKDFYLRTLHRIEQPKRLFPTHSDNSPVVFQYHEATNLPSDSAPLTGVYIHSRKAIKATIASR